ncbi:MAG: ethanolamine utilization protein EutJ [Anaerolineae bacterium]|nr:ethanolamine utilization protein EutJ [Anaerolineae bacterium]
MTGPPTTANSPAALNGRPVQVGVDLGTAFTVIAVLDADRQPLAGAYRFAQVVRDGLVVDFQGAISLLTELKMEVEAGLGFSLTSASSTYPPGVPLAEVQSTRYVVEAAGFVCRQLIDEPTAANAVLQVRDGAVVDIGGGTTGVAIFRDGEVVHLADEATGGTHFSLVIAGALDLSFEEAELRKRDPANHTQLFPLVRPVMEKVATIVARHIAAHAVETIYLVGGTACFSGIGPVIEEITGVKTVIPVAPMFVTPFGVAMYDS